MSSKSLPPPQAHYTPVATGDHPTSSYAATALGGMFLWGLNQFNAGVGAQTGFPQPSAVSAAESNTLGGMGSSAATVTPNSSRRNSITTLTAAGGGGGGNGGATGISSSSTAQGKPSSMSQDREFYFGPSHFKATGNDEAELYAQYRGTSDL